MKLDDAELKLDYLRIKLDLSYTVKVSKHVARSFALGACYFKDVLSKKMDFLLRRKRFVGYDC